MKHQLKTVNPHFQDVASGKKTFEIRSEEDRTFSEGDILVLRQYDPDSGYSGVSMEVEVVHIVREYLPPKMVVMGIKKLSTTWTPR